MKDYSKTIETERLILRKFVKEDVNDMFKNYCSRDKVSEFVTWQTHKNIEVTKEYLENIVLPEYEKENTYRWAIVLKSINQVIGCIDVVNFNIDKKCAEIGYVLSDDFWGNGIMPEAGKAVINYLFSEGFVRIWAIHFVENLKSGRVMQKIGMSHEGTLRKVAKNNKGELIDCELYAVIKD